MQDVPRHIEQAISYLKKQVGKNGLVVLFGSRARRITHRNADFDIGISTISGYDWRQFAVWKTRAEDIAWPYKIDIVDLTRAPQEFLDAILKETIVLHGVRNGHALPTAEA